MTESAFVYVTYIAASQQRVFDALVKPEFTRKYWGHENVSEWKVGTDWEHRSAEDGKVKLVGKVLEFIPPRRLVITWADPADAAKTSSHTRVTFELETMDENVVKLTVTHDQLVPGSDMERGIREGWPRVLSSLKSFLETGKPLQTWAGKAPSRR
jgi:uncharacterized protein YndB with AHSA1/START domain